MQNSKGLFHHSITRHMILGTEINNSAAWQPSPGLRSAKTNEVLTMALARQACREEKKKNGGVALPGLTFFFVPPFRTDQNPDGCLSGKLGCVEGKIVFICDAKGSDVHHRKSSASIPRHRKIPSRRWGEA